MPGPAEVGGDDRQLREPSRDDVQVDRPGGVELDALATGLPRADATGTGVTEAWNLQFRGLLPELEVALIARIEVLHRRMELGTLRPQLLDRALQLLHGVRLPGIDRGKEGESLGMAFDDGTDEVVGERWPGGCRLRIPGEQDPKELLLGKIDSELVDAALVHLAAEVACRRLAVRTHAAIQPFLQRQMDVQVDGPDHIRTRAAPIVRP